MKRRARFSDDMYTCQDDTTEKLQTAMTYTKAQAIAIGKTWAVTRPGLALAEAEVQFREMYAGYFKRSEVAAFKAAYREGSEHATEA